MRTVFYIKNTNIKKVILVNLLTRYNLNIVNLNEIKLDKKILDKNFLVNFRVLIRIVDVFPLEILKNETDKDQNLLLYNEENIIQSIPLDV